MCEYGSRAKKGGSLWSAQRKGALAQLQKKKEARIMCQASSSVDNSRLMKAPKLWLPFPTLFSFFQANPFNFTHTLAVCGTFITALTPHFSCHIDAVGVSGFPTPPISSERDEPLGQFYRFPAPAELCWASEAQYQPWKGGVPRLKEARARELSSATRSFCSYREGKKRKET